LQFDIYWKNICIPLDNFTVVPHTSSARVSLRIGESMSVDELLFELLKVDKLYDYRVKLEIYDRKPYLVAHYQTTLESERQYCKFLYDGKQWCEDE
jgi:hypothetical protein